MQRRVALVTGAATGIGRAVSTALARAQWTVIMAGRRAARLDEAAREGGPRCVPMTCDVSDEESVNALFQRIETDIGRLDLLFNNAGVASAPAALEDTSLSSWRSVIDTNLTGAFLCTRAAFRLMRSQDPSGGRIINNGSISATVPRPAMIAYTASKHAVTGLTKSTALEGRRYDIACGQIDIGNTATDMTLPMSHGTLQADGSRMAEPQFDVRHVADAVLYMAGLPLDANVLFMTVMATKMPYVGRG
ncbi:MAG TPA: SDR family oxidoreductase [Steroidobacteraceae bacterium]|nr:SDR family oxidoreductase [Steroidobacteraceae bacterium]